jgi:probable rRNA maturation factor
MKGRGIIPRAVTMVLIKNSQRLIKTDLRRLRRDSERLLVSVNLRGAEVGILLVNDRRMRELNRRYRGIDRTTDVLSFPVHESLKDIGTGSEILIGDIVINLPLAARQSKDFGETVPGEVRRLLIHGFLHLLGFDHERSAYQARRMRTKERELRDALEAVD